MTSEPMLLEPELESLLREVAADPDSSLLRVPRAKALPMLYEDRPAAGPATAGLSSAEREILRVHRLEVAWLLRQVCVWKLVEGAKSRDFVSAHLTANRRVELASPETLKSAGRATIEDSLEPTSCTAGLQLFEQAMASTPERVPTVLDLAVAAHRLHPSDNCRILAGQDLALGDFPRSALALLSTVLPAPSTNRIALSAWSAVGLAHSKLNDLSQAHFSYTSASLADSEVLVPWMDRMAFALQIGDRADAIRVSTHLAHLVDVSHAVVTWFVASRLARRRTGEWTPTSTATHLLNSLQDALGEVGRRISDVFV